MTKDFLDKEYKVPASSSGYMKMEQGDNVFRILASAIIGYEYWTNENKPIRSKEYPQETPNGKVEKKTGKVRVNHFWAFPVWNYTEKKVQILEITQKTIQTAIQNLTFDEDWGNPFGYDIKINRVGEGLETSYTVSPKPKKELDKKITKEFEEMNINLDELYVSGDPFNSGKKQEKVSVDDDPMSDIPFD